MSTLQVIARIQAAREGGEILEPVRCDHSRVFDPYSAEAHEVETRLDGHDVALQQCVLVRPAQRRLLVHVQPDTVAGRVVHPGPSLGALETLGRRPVTSVHQDLAYALVNVAA